MDFPRPSPFLALVAALALTGFGTWLTGCGTGADGPSDPSSPPPSETARLTVDAASVLRTVDSGVVLGGNLGIWVRPDRLGSPTDRYVVDRGAGLLRFPGGSMASRFCWKTMRVLQDGGIWESWTWGTTVDDYLAFLRTTRARPLYGLNPFDHTIDGVVHSAAGEAEALATHMVAAGFPGAY